MCQAAGNPGVDEALAMLDRALDALADADVASLTVDTQAAALRALERVQARQMAAQARVLSVFMAQGGAAADGHGTAKAWLRWQTQVTRAAAAASVGWARRLDQHPEIAAALAGGDLSASWAKAICGWTDRLAEDQRADADRILAAAAAGGAELADLAGLAEELYRRTAGPDTDGPGTDGPDTDGGELDERYLTLGITWRGAGRVEGDLTPGCAAALSAVVEALGKKAGPEDTRTAAQRRHDALEEACRRLIAAGMVPARAGQPTHIQLHMTLSQLRDLPGAAEAEAEWAAARADEPGWLTGPEAEAAACDATIIPIVSGHPDPAALDRLTGAFLATHTSAHSPEAAVPESAVPQGAVPDRAVSQGAVPDSAWPHGGGQHGGGPRAADAEVAGLGVPGEQRLLPPASRRRLRRALLGLAAEVLSGPGGLAGWLRTGLVVPGAASPSLPLDVGTATDLIPAQLRRAAMTRHRHCSFPGCQQPASVCQLHHLVPRREGGQTTLRNLVPLCAFHHLVAIHRWGWRLVLNTDGTTTATCPDGTRTLHSHGPPTQAA